jgi:hypothetical protein
MIWIFTSQPFTNDHSQQLGFFLYEFMCILVSLFDTFDISYCINSHFSDFVFFVI